MPEDLDRLPFRREGGDRPVDGALVLRAQLALHRLDRA